ncbi:MAG TPA: POTRA domain-containing protein, partial [Candidatus Kapabacteria bacterium]|nr:POTRA domain-containing protein [Candidatus Kapabacteria bacterium]
MKSQETGLITDIQDNTPSELNNIIFTGNTFFTSSQLLEILSLRTSNFSPGLIFFTRLRKESLKNPYTPKAFTDHLQGVVKSYQESEIRYYNPAIAADDSATILELYNQFGFHRATIQYSFFQDSLSQTNTLRFDINEGIRNTVDTVVYKGLERITQQLKEKIEKIRTVKRDSPFDEAQIK